MDELITVQLMDGDTKHIANLTATEIEAVSSDPIAYEAKVRELTNENCLSESAVYSPRPSKNKWSNKNTKLMLDLRLGMEQEFLNPTCKKSKLWEEISSQMKSYGYNLSATDCHNKYRNLLQTYKQNKEKRLKTGESKIVWDFYYQFDSVLGLGTEPLTVPSTKRERKKNVKVKDNGKKSEISLTHYLYLKDKRQTEAQQKAEERWREKIELKKKKIDAINNLAKAILNTNMMAKGKRNNAE